MQHTRTAADRHQNRRAEDDQASSMVIREQLEDEEGMEQARVVQKHEFILFTVLGSIWSPLDRENEGGWSL